MRRDPCVVYTSGSMSGRNARQWWKHIRRGKQVALDLMSTGDYLVLSPHLDAHFDECDGYDQWDWQRWIDYDLALLRSIVEIVFDYDPDVPSKGRDAEVAYAKKHGIPVAHSREELDRIAHGIRKGRNAA